MPPRDPDDGEIDDVQEFLDTLGEVEYDDVLLSLLGDGGNLDVPGDVVDQQLANALSGWRNDVDREPVRDEAIGQKHPAGGEWPPAITGGTVSVQDDAAQLRNIAPGDHARSMAAEVRTDTEARIAAAAVALGEGHAGMQTIQSAAGAVTAAVDALEGALGMFTDAINQVADNVQRG
ncbi:hypothetical protein ACFWIW_10820 [Amycolatopsis sp. NPDC058340]|uniref:hypothetical protein n=1 Tax=Amycolatopsis sp. NPDC058340 TaxID=3346453 RepID=UPI00365C195A